MEEEKVISNDIVSDEFEQFISTRISKLELVNLRKSKKLTQKELSDISGLSVKCISDIESETTGNPTMKSLIKYLNCLGYELYFQKKNI